MNISELELKALRAQINPHFIFNCLNSIHHYMNHHAVKQAGDYLVKFSQLIRYVLETSALRLVPLSNDLEALRSYIELEQLRMQNSFDYTVNVVSIDDLDTVHIPPMMMQPFVENSIWHGLAGKGSGGRIDITIEMIGDMIQCTIEDNGLRNRVREESMMPPGAIKKTSMGMALIKERLATVSQIYKVNADFKIEDKALDPTPGEGTRVLLNLPCEC